MSTVHHLGCISMCPRFGAVAPINERREMVIHVLAIETARDGLVVVDTGYGSEAAANPGKIPRLFRFIARPAFDTSRTARAQIEALGYSASDVRHVVVTHLDLDHAGGLRDFPDAVVHVHARELEAAQRRETRQEKARYLPYQLDGVEFATYSDAGDEWLGLDAVRSLHNLEADIALVPFFGHTVGHSGVAVRVEKGWLLHAGDAYFHHSDLENPPKGTWALNRFQKAAAMDNTMRIENRNRLAELKRRCANELDIFSAHDPVELERYL